MSDGDHLDAIFRLAVHNEEWKALEEKASGIPDVFGPGIGSLTYAIDSSIDLVDECPGDGLPSLSVPERGGMGFGKPNRGGTRQPAFLSLLPYDGAACFAPGNRWKDAGVELLDPLEDFPLPGFLGVRVTLLIEALQKKARECCSSLWRKLQSGIDDSLFIWAHRRAMLQ